MSKKSKVLIIIGVFLIVLSCLFLINSQLINQKSQTNSAEIIATLNEIIPERFSGMPDDFSSMEMPVVEIKNEDIVAILEIQRFGLELPVGNEWDSKNTKFFPRRFVGSVYDNSLVIGGSDRPNQFDCMDKIQIGEDVKVTDITGAQFCYEVSNIFRSKSADSETLTKDDSDLTLWVKDEFSLDYIIVCCTIK